jgi:hypothetical protein
MWPETPNGGQVQGGCLFLQIKKSYFKISKKKLLALVSDVFYKDAKYFILYRLHKNNKSVIKSKVNRAYLKAISDLV